MRCIQFAASDGRRDVLGGILGGARRASGGGQELGQRRPPPFSQHAARRQRYQHSHLRRLLLDCDHRLGHDDTFQVYTPNTRLSSNGIRLFMACLRSDK